MATAVEKTTPQVHTAISYEGELAKPSKIANKFYAKVREIRRDPTIKLVRQFAVAPIVAGKWTYEKRNDAPEGAAEFIEREIERLRMQIISQAMLGMIDYGWQSFERVVCDNPDGSWGIKWLKPLLPDITEILVDAKDGTFLGLRQEPMSIVSTPAIVPFEVTLEREDCVLFSAEVEGTNWYGEPVMKALESIYDEQAVINTSARKYDAKIAGSHWVIYYPLGISKYKGVEIDNGALAQELIKGIEAMGGIALPQSVIQATDALNQQLGKDASSQWRVELISDKGNGQTPFLERYKYLDILKVRAFGYPERALLEGQFGTKAEAEAHADLAILNLEWKHEDLTKQTNVQLVDWYLRNNYGPETEGSVFIKPAPLADRAIAFFREIYKLLIQNRDGFYMEAQAVDWKAFRANIGLPEAPIMPELQQLDEYGNAIGVPPIEAVDPITGMPITDPSLIPVPAPDAMPQAFARDVDGKYGDGGRTLEQQRDFDHIQKMNKLKAELEGSKQAIEINGRERKLVVKEVRTSREAGRRKVAYTHTGEAYDLENNHVASVVRFPGGNWREG